MRLATHEVMGRTVSEAKLALSAMGIDFNTDEFIVIQPLDDGQYIKLESVEEEDGRKLKIEVSNSLVILPKLEGTLTLFSEREECN